MNRTCKLLVAVGLAVGLGWSLYQAGGQPDKDFKPGDAVETIEVKLDLGAGEDLEEAVALDLGLGFPLWLHPVGRKEESAPFGAVPQQTTAKDKVAAETSVTFTFNLKGEDGQDAFRTTPQLLAGLRVGDIARVGFASQGNSDWALAGYEIKINGKVFAAGKPKDEQAGKAKTAQEAARKKLADLDLQIGPLETARAELADLVKTDLATAEDKQQIEAIVAKLVPLAAAKRQLDGQLQGLYPWFEDQEFTSPWREKLAIKSARVVLVTDTHSDADTQNYVYFHTGGRKYLLGAPGAPLTGTAGPQTFTLDLQAGPLTKADLRGWAVGMLAHPNPLGKAPDRWHPRRFRVEIDGKVVFDSEDREQDRRSLEAIRLIPPVHKDEDGQLVTNTPIARETYVWKAGQGSGLDADKGTPLPLPDPKDDNAPKPETPAEKPETPEPTDPEAKVEPKTPEPAPMDVDKVPMDPDKAAPFPGEKAAPPSEPGGPSGSGGSSGSGTPSDPSGSSGSGTPSDPSGSPSGSGTPSDPNTQPGPGTEPDPKTPPDNTPMPTPTGTSFQVHHVRITGGIWKADQPFKVSWKVTGDEKAIDHYVVSLQPVQPHLDDPYSAPGILLANVPKGGRSASGPLGPLPPGVDPRTLYLRPVVTAVPVDPMTPPADPMMPTPTTPNAGTGPARAIFPAGSTVIGQPTLQTPFVWWHTPAPPAGLQTQAISWMGPSKGQLRAAWPVNQVVRSDNDVQFDSAWPGRHLGVRLQEGDTVRLELRIPKAAFAGGKRHLVAHLGFLGGPGAQNTVKAHMICSWRTSTDAAVPGSPPTVFVPAPAGKSLETASGDAMKLFDQEFNAAGLPATAHHLRVRVYVTGGPFAPTHPPGLFGVRLVP